MASTPNANPNNPASREPSAGPAPALQQQRNSSVHSRSRSATGSSGPRQRGERKRPGRGNGLPGIDQTDNKDALQLSGENAGQPRQQQRQPLQSQKGGDEEDGGRGDKPLNLDVAVEINARVHGDLTLSLL
ncbi:hypothetical protein J3R30DRAFT_3700784 [Lentinula aciculospora]|uniref:Uncharacterized protein n=1 Tax=Lentinula aciculospora TaxID=153920 RepID=A0A9W9AEZ2_9AGAR|nr:hypothetical protein J3R30DRAFT_3700784 [Lentinula aciculospora]